MIKKTTGIAAILSLILGIIIGIGIGIGIGIAKANSHSAQLPAENLEAVALNQLDNTNSQLLASLELNSTLNDLNPLNLDKQDLLPTAANKVLGRHVLPVTLQPDLTLNHGLRELGLLDLTV